MAGDSREQAEGGQRQEPGQREDPGQRQEPGQRDEGGPQPGRKPLWGPNLEFKPAPKQEPGSQPDRPPRESDGWQILSYMLGGMILYGGIGWLVSRWTGITLLFPLGMILGIGLSVTMIIFRYTRS